MILDRIAIQEFKQFAGRIEINDLLPGLNIFAGANEQGKSTIAQAVRTVFIERHKVTTLKELRPWAKPSGNPLVEVDFKVDGASYALKKQFFKPRCELIAAGKTFKEEDAEDHLAQLMGFTHSPKGATRPEHAGVPGLLWVEQGTIQDVKGAAGNAASYLRDALAQLAGSDVSGGEDVLISAVQRELFLLLTDKQRRPTGVMLEAINQLNTFITQRADLLKQHEQYDADMESLARVQAEHAKVAQDKPWEAFEKTIAEADAQVRAIGQLEQRLTQSKELLRSTNAELDLLLEQESGDVTAERRVQTQQTALVTSQGELTKANEAQAEAGAAVEAAEQGLTRANAARDLANVAVLKQYLEELCRLYEAQAQQAAAQAERAVEVEEEIAAARASLTGPVEENALLELRGAVAFLNDCEVLEKAGFPQMKYTLSSTLPATDGTLSGTGELLVDRPSYIDFLDLGQIEVVPAVDRATLADKRASFEAIRDSALQKLDARSPDEVEARIGAQAVAKDKLDALERLLAAYAPHGVATLTLASEQASTRLGELKAQLAGLPDTEHDVSLEEARQAAMDAADRLESARKVFSRASDGRSAKAATLESMTTALATAQAQLADPAFVSRQAARAIAIVEKRAAVTGLNSQVQTVTGELEAARASGLAAQVDRARAAANAARAQQKDRESQIITLRSRLETVGASGLDERIAKLNASVEQAERRVAELKLRADALSMLEKSLIDERDRAVEKLRAPLTKRLAHYLKFLFTDTSMAVTDNLSPAAFNRAQRDEELEALSVGTQEQLGILTRLAYADLLRDAGRPTLIMLDDVAVFADNDRRAGLKAALADAATRHQILLFTCRPDDWSDLGVAPRSVEDIKAA
jgi:hypothetical protein